MFALAGYGQTFWTETFNNGCTQLCNASGYVGTNGAWTIADFSPPIDPCGSTTVPNEWFVSCAENGHTAGVCGSNCVPFSSTATLSTLHIASVQASPNGSSLCPFGDCGANYDAGGWCDVLGTGPATTTDKRAESPTINCTGHSGIVLNFNYIMGGQNAQDYAFVEYSDNNGVTWNFLASPNPTLMCGGQGQWAAYTFLLPVSCDNNPTVKIAFHWINDDDGSGADPSFAADNITLGATAANSITTGVIAGSPFCGCNTINVPFTSVGTYSAGNTYTAELSDASGNFGAAVAIGTLSSTANFGIISCTIPCNTIAGNGYLIRVVSSNPVITGSSNGVNISITAAPVATFSYTSSPYCQSGSNPLPSFSGGATAGFFTAAPAGLVFVNSFTGEINLAASSPGTYTVTNSIAASGNCAATNATASVTIVSPPTPTITSSGTIVSCGGGSVTLTASSIAGGTYLWNTAQTTQSITVTSSGVYTVTETYGASSCTGTSVPFNLGTSSQVVPLCLVTIDSLSTNTIVVWEKTGIGAEVDSFRVYREVATNVYSNIASVSNDSLSEYHDYSANPNVTSYKYKLATLDTCGGISPLSDFHNSIHLQYLGYGNLQWTLYDIENAANPVNVYIVTRDDNNTGNFLPISTNIPGSNNTYTDLNYLSFPNAAYRVDVSWSISCNPTRNSSTPSSNIVLQDRNASVSELDAANLVSIYPNPFTSQTTISFEESQSNTGIKITDVLGKEIKTIHFTGKECVIEKGEMEKGIYFVQITSGNKNTVNRKIIVQ